MASALTDAQKYSLFQILEVPWNVSGAGITYGFYTVDEMGSLASQVSVSGGTQSVAQTAILQYLDDMHTNKPDLETDVIVHITRWRAIGTTMVRVENGQSGANTGVTWNPEEERGKIREFIKWAVPFFRHHEVLERRMGTARSITIPAVR